MEVDTDLSTSELKEHFNIKRCGSTVLWFEFLVDPSLLIPHLSQEKAEPSATELISKLLTVYNNTSNNNNENLQSDQQEFSLRGIALKILALKIAAFLKWDLKVFQSKLSLPIQIKLLEDLMYITSGKVTHMSKQVLNVDIENCSNEVLFAATCWHRWIVSGLVHRGIQQKNVRLQTIQLPTSGYDNNYSNPQFVDDFNRYNESILASSVTFLHDLLKSKRVPNVLNVDTFIALTDTVVDVKQNWDNTTKISNEEFYLQIHYDLATLYFFEKKFTVSKVHFLKCLELYEHLPVDTFLEFNFLKHLQGYLIANNETFTGYQPSLLYKFYQSVRNGFAGTINIMNIDNVERSLPLIHRQLTEIETMGALSCEKYYVAKDILLQFSTLNLVRSVIDGNTFCPMKIISLLNTHGNKAADILVIAFTSVLNNLSVDDLHRVQCFFLHMKPYLNKDHFKKLYQHPKLSALLNHEQKKLTSDKMPVFKTDTNISNLITKDYHNLSFELKLLQRNIIQCYDFKKLQLLLIDWYKKSQGKNLLRINPKWQLPIPIQSVVMSLEDPMMQCLAFLVLAKGRELMLAKDYKNSLRMYSQVTDTECMRTSTNAIVMKLYKLVSWEVLLVKVIQFTDEWQSQDDDKTDDLVAKCKECLQAQPTDYTTNVIPRTELIEHFSLFLLNVGEWEFITNLEKRWNYFELTTTVAQACQDFTNGSKKMNKDIWELILPVFGPSLVNTQQSKRGPNASLHRDSPTTKTKLNLLGFISNLRNECALSLMIALLARMYNIFKDETSLELIVDNLSIWPAVITNANSYDSKAVSEMLWETLEIALKYYPNNATWLKLMGDMNFCNEYSEAALKCYIKSLIVTTEYFSQSIQKSLLFDDQTIKRMIKCCTEMNCYTQAVVLCQFLDQVDYTTAFQCLSEMKPGNCQDAMDAYYSCIWDTTLLEYLIYLHNKRGEEHRKREAIRIIGQLELNSNNSDEIKREASEIRKRKFMRAMAKQYVIKYPI